MFLLLMMLLGGLYMSYRINKLRRQTEEQMRGGGTYSRTTYRNYGNQPKQPREGEVSVEQTQPKEKKINSNVGDYVDYEDVGPKNDKK